MKLKIQKTPVLKPAEVTRKWHIIDASGIVLGELAVAIANKLSGRTGAKFSPHVDSGDHVVVINAKQIRVTGNKLQDKKYYRHSGYPGSMKEITLEAKLEKAPEEVIRLAVRGMLPKNKLASDMLLRLKVYPGAEHNHAAQKPVEMKVGA